jgi:hypothetical protein
MAYVITPHTKAQAKEAGLTVKPSTKRGKKIDVYNSEGQYLASVGALGYKDYGMYLQEGDKKVAEERRRLYHLRHTKNTLPERLASFLLW